MSVRERLPGQESDGIAEAPEYMTVQQVATLLQLKPKTVYDLARKGAIPSVKIGGSRRFPRRQLIEALDEQTESFDIPPIRHVHT